MNKDEILEMSRKENKDKDLFEKHYITKSTSIVTIAVSLLSLIFFISEILICRKFTQPVILVYAYIANAIMNLYTAIKTKNKKKLFIAIPWIALTILSLIATYCEYFDRAFVR